MGSKKKPNLPQAPSFQADPNLANNADFLTFAGQSLAQGAFLPGQSAVVPERLQSQFGGINFDFLNPLVSLNPEFTQRSVDLASRDVIRNRDLAQQSILNELEANNQLTSSTSVNRLSDLNEQFSGDIADIATTFYLADVERAFSNTSSLFGLGLETSRAAGSLGAENQRQQNTFALQNFNNQVALALADQESGRGGFGGALSGALGGGLAGFAVGGPIGAGVGAVGGGLAGGFGPQGTGTSIFSGGASLGGFGGLAGPTTQASPIGSPFGSGLPGHTPLSSATDLNRFRRIGVGTGFGSSSLLAN